MKTFCRVVYPIVQFRKSTYFYRLRKVFHHQLPTSLQLQILPFLICKRDISSSSTHCAVPEHWGQKKQHRKVKLNYNLGMASAETEVLLAPFRQSVKEQVPQL